VIKSKRQMAGNVARMGRVEVRTEFWWENLREADHLKDPGIDGRIILKWILEQLDGGIDRLRIGIGGGLL
jgi:hypothetical protein